MKLFYNTLAFLFCVLTLGLVDVEIKYSDRTRFKWVGWFSRMFQPKRRMIMDKCRQVCPYNTLDGCKVKEYGCVCPLTNTANQITEHKMTHADRIRAMSDEGWAELIRSMVDGRNNDSVAGYGCINYGTHHSDPANKGTYLYECDGCENEGIGLDVLMWLQQPAEGE